MRFLSMFASSTRQQINRVCSLSFLCRGAGISSCPLLWFYSGVKEMFALARKHVHAAHVEWLPPCSCFSVFFQFIIQVEQHVKFLVLTTDALVTFTLFIPKKAIFKENYSLVFLYYRCCLSRQKDVF